MTDEATELEKCEITFSRPSPLFESVIFHRCAQTCSCRNFISYKSRRAAAVCDCSTSAGWSKSSTRTSFSERRGRVRTTSRRGGRDPRSCRPLTGPSPLNGSRSPLPPSRSTRPRPRRPPALLRAVAAGDVFGAARRLLLLRRHRRPLHLAGVRRGAAFWRKKSAADYWT